MQQNILKNKKTHLLTTLMLALFCCFAMPLQASEFLLFYGNDVRGETEPCG